MKIKPVERTAVPRTEAARASAAQTSSVKTFGDDAPLVPRTREFAEGIHGVGMELLKGSILADFDCAEEPRYDLG